MKLDETLHKSSFSNNTVTYTDVRSTTMTTEKNSSPYERTLYNGNGVVVKQIGNNGIDGSYQIWFRNELDIPELLQEIPAHGNDLSVIGYLLNYNGHHISLNRLRDNILINGHITCKNQGYGMMRIERYPFEKRIYANNQEKLIRYERKDSLSFIGVDLVSVIGTQYIKVNDDTVISPNVIESISITMSCDSYNGKRHTRVELALMVKGTSFPFKREVTITNEIDGDYEAKVEKSKLEPSVFKASVDILSGECDNQMFMSILRGVAMFEQKTKAFTL